MEINAPKHCWQSTTPPNSVALHWMRQRLPNFESCSMFWKVSQGQRTPTLDSCPLQLPLSRGLEERPCTSPLNRDPPAACASQEKSSTAPYPRDAHETLKAARPVTVQALAVRHTLPYQEERRGKLERWGAHCWSATTHMAQDAEPQWNTNTENKTIQCGVSETIFLPKLCCAAQEDKLTELKELFQDTSSTSLTFVKDFTAR